MCIFCKSHSYLCCCLLDILPTDWGDSENLMSNFKQQQETDVLWRKLNNLSPCGSFFIDLFKMSLTLNYICKWVPDQFVFVCLTYLARTVEGILSIFFCISCTKRELTGEESSLCTTLQPEMKRRLTPAENRDRRLNDCHKTEPLPPGSSTQTPALKNDLGSKTFESKCCFLRFNMTEVWGSCALWWFAENSVNMKQLGGLKAEGLISTETLKHRSWKIRKWSQRAHFSKHGEITEENNDMYEINSKNSPLLPFSSLI